MIRMCPQWVLFFGCPHIENMCIKYTLPCKIASSVNCTWTMKSGFNPRCWKTHWQTFTRRGLITNSKLVFTENGSGVSDFCLTPSKQSVDSQLRYVQPNICAIALDSSPSATKLKIVFSDLRTVLQPASCLVTWEELTFMTLTIKWPLGCSVIRDSSMLKLLLIHS